MPIYGYRCQQCGHEVEMMQSFSDQPLRTCPVCMGPLQKRLYPVGVIYKGSGYYTTDYRSSKDSGGKDGEGKASSSKAGSDKADSGKADSGKTSSGGSAGSEAGSKEKSGSGE